MADFEMSIHTGTLAEWPDEQVSQAWRVVSSAVRRLGLAPSSDAAIAKQLQVAEGDAAMFGEELMRRGLL